MMFDLEAEILVWIKSLRSNPGFEDGDIEEIEIHIRDSIETGIYNGLSPQEAFEKTTTSFGQLEELGNELIKSRTNSIALPKRDFLAHNYETSNNPISANIILFGNYLKLALRKIRKQPLYFIVNIIGLSIAFPCFVFMIFL